MGYSRQIVDYFQVIEYRWWLCTVCVAVACICICILLKLREKIGTARVASFCLLIPYCFLILVSTVFSREKGTEYLFQLELFAAYKHFAQVGVIGILYENAYNVMMFIPIGFLICSFFKKNYLLPCCVGGFCFSLTIEFSQLIMKCGFFEIDDIIHNSLGAICGGLLYISLLRMRQWYYRRKHN